MQSWKEVPATIRSAELKRNPGSDSVTYETLAEYDYIYSDRKYTGKRVSRYFGSDNIGSFHQDIYSELSLYRDSKKPFRCYVNPNAPEEAILYRKARLPMLCFYGVFAATFGGVGYGVLAAMLVTFVNSKRAAALEKLYPGQPWKARTDWSRNEVRTFAGFRMILSISIAIFIGAIAIPVLIFIPGELMDGNKSALYALIYPLVAGVIITWALRAYLQWKRFGSAVLQLNGNPVRPGERLRGIIKTGADLPQSVEVNLELICNRATRRRSGNKTVIHHDTAWNRYVTVMGMTGADGKTCIQVDIEIPEGVPQTGTESNNSEIAWELKVKADIPGIDLNAKFVIPVFKIA
jgi:hypothetical protein